MLYLYSIYDCRWVQVNTFNFLLKTHEQCSHSFIFFSTMYSCFKKFVLFITCAFITPPTGQFPKCHVKGAFTEFINSDTPGGTTPHHWGPQFHIVVTVKAFSFIFSLFLYFWCWRRATPPSLAFAEGLKLSKCPNQEKRFLHTWTCGISLY